MIKITKETEEKIISLIKDGLSVPEIMEKLGIGKNTIYKYAAEHNLSLSVFKITDEIAIKILQMHNDKLKPKEIAEYFGCCFETIIRFLKKNGFDVTRPCIRKIPKEKEDKISELVAQGFSRAKIAELLNIPLSWVKKIVKRDNLKSVNKTAKGKITEEIGEKIINLHSEGMSAYGISKLINVSKRNILRFLNNNGIDTSIKKLSLEEIKLKNENNRLRHNVSRLIYIKLKNNGGSKEGKSISNYLPYTIQELKEHLESQFEPWMNWDNQGFYKLSDWNDNDPSTWKWQLDHIIPQSDLFYSSMKDENFKKCWALSNLRPYSAKQNVLDGTQGLRNGKTNRGNKKPNKSDI